MTLHLVLYLSVQVTRWNPSGVINLPLTDEFQSDLSLLVDLLKIINKVDGWESVIPTYYQRMFQLVRLVDYAGADEVLQEAATHLGTFPSRINNSNGIHSVRMIIRNPYRMAKKINVREGKTGTCGICHSSLLPPPPLLPQPFEMPCCKSLIHPSCQQNWAMCPFCSTPFTALVCCVCHTDIDPGPVYLDWWVASKDYRTPCCESEMHPECVPNLIWVRSGFQGHCALCPL